METERSACWKEHDGEGKKPLCSQRKYLQEIPWFQIYDS